MVICKVIVTHGLSTVVDMVAAQRSQLFTLASLGKFKAWYGDGTMLSDAAPKIAPFQCMQTA